MRGIFLGIGTYDGPHRFETCDWSMWHTFRDTVYKNVTLKDSRLIGVDPDEDANLETLTKQLGLCWFTFAPIICSDYGFGCGVVGSPTEYLYWVDLATVETVDSRREHRNATAWCVSWAGDWCITCSPDKPACTWSFNKIPDTIYGFWSGDLNKAGKSDFYVAPDSTCWDSVGWGCYNSEYWGGGDSPETREYPMYVNYYYY